MRCLPTSTRSGERWVYRRSQRLHTRVPLSSLRESIVALQSALVLSGDPTGLASEAKAAYIDFANAPRKVVGVTVNEADDDAQPVRGCRAAPCEVVREEKDGKPRPRPPVADHGIR